jgi:hypothetical protein
VFPLCLFIRFLSSLLYLRLSCRCKIPPSSCSRIGPSHSRHTLRFIPRCAPLRHSCIVHTVFFFALDSPPSWNHRPFSINRILLPSSIVYFNRLFRPRFRLPLLPILFIYRMSPSFMHRRCTYAAHRPSLSLLSLALSPSSCRSRFPALSSFIPSSLSLFSLLAVESFKCINSVPILFYSLELTFWSSYSLLPCRFLHIRVFGCGPFFIRVFAAFLVEMSSIGGGVW